MTLFDSLALVNWGMGTFLIGIFAVVCIALVLIVLNMMNNDKKKEDIEEK
ncbi:hypothetical protein SAMN05444483_11184 [Salegentibacter echinorum]|uniref:Oxaloacetate decarboxylase, gamma chain n=1 Tax=Salegentibacter echinorum TaxID=1073325 RepID=A0A1M5JMB1_SALEC|nr:hypothetical protein [Salegentibacter echinorum]SHG41722.1 hypothetical protein SAMN05444483_11184 [Salegentibacter echinorum]